MAQIWLETKKDWNPVELEGSAAFRLIAGVEPAIEPLDSDSIPSGGEDVILRRLDDGGAQWALLCRRYACKVNGTAVVTGLCCLPSRAEIVLPKTERSLLYSAETAPKVTIYQGEVIKCPRCHRAIASGSPIVACPACHVAHHEDDANSSPCWSYAPQCAVCLHSTAMNTGYEFPPEGW